MTSSSEIATLLKTEMYNPDIIPQLESYLISQVQQSSATAPSNTYDFEANRTLIKLYQFFPQQAKTEFILLAESLALIYGEATKEGSHDFGSLGCLINESAKKDEPYPTLIRCADLLESCQYTEFWGIFDTIAANSTEYNVIATLSKSNHARNALRKTILNSLSLTFKSTKLSFLLQQLNFESKSNEGYAFLEGEETIIEQLNKNLDSVVFKNNAENIKRLKTSQETGFDYGMIRSVVNINQNKAVVE